MNFLETIFTNLAQPASKPILHEIVDGMLQATTTRELLELVEQARLALRAAGLQPGDRCGLLGPNSKGWVALDLAIMAEGAIVVPLYHRQAPAELAAMMKDCAPKLLCCASPSLQQSITEACATPPRTLLYSDIWPDPLPVIPPDAKIEAPRALDDSRPVTIIYTSGTSGQSKGVVLNIGNISYMLGRTTARLVELMDDVSKQGDDRIFHYLPFVFAGSWILLLTCLSRNNALMLSMDLNKLPEEMSAAQPHYFMNVPALLERIRNGITAQLRQSGGIGLYLFNKGEAAWKRRRDGQACMGDGFWLALAMRLVFANIKDKISPNMRGLICGSAPLTEETQHFFQMIGIPVLQVYGLTETTAICTMDDVHCIKPGFVGPAIPGIEMKLGSNDEILVRGPNVFPGYWNRPEATADMLKDGWLHTGDQGSVDETGNWKITGRIKDLIIPSSGHNISPEPLEQMLQSALPEAGQIMLVGNQRKFLSLLVTGNIAAETIQKALDQINPRLPHYKQIHRFYRCPEPFSQENGLLTANQKLRRAAIEACYKEQIDQLYEGNS
jgi:long-chain acyl-CoA synthetase